MIQTKDHFKKPKTQKSGLNIPGDDGRYRFVEAILKKYGHIRRATGMPALVSLKLFHYKAGIPGSVIHNHIITHNCFYQFNGFLGPEVRQKTLQLISDHCRPADTYHPALNRGMEVNPASRDSNSEPDNHGPYHPGIPLKSIVSNIPDNRGHIMGPALRSKTVLRLNRQSILLRPFSMIPEKNFHSRDLVHGRPDSPVSFVLKSPDMAVDLTDVAPQANAAHRSDTGKVTFWTVKSGESINDNQDEPRRLVMQNGSRFAAEDRFKTRFINNMPGNDKFWSSMIITVSDVKTYSKSWRRDIHLQRKVDRHFTPVLKHLTAGRTLNFHPIHQSFINFGSTSPEEQAILMFNDQHPKRPGEAIFAGAKPADDVSHNRDELKTFLDSKKFSIVENGTVINRISGNDKLFLSSMIINVPDVKSYLKSWRNDIHLHRRADRHLAPVLKYLAAGRRFDFHPIHQSFINSRSNCPEEPENLMFTEQYQRRTGEATSEGAKPAGRESHNRDELKTLLSVNNKLLRRHWEQRLLMSNESGDSKREIPSNLLSNLISIPTIGHRKAVESGFDHQPALIRLHRHFSFPVNRILKLAHTEVTDLTDLTNLTNVWQSNFSHIHAGLDQLYPNNRPGPDQTNLPDVYRTGLEHSNLTKQTGGAGLDKTAGEIIAGLSKNHGESPRELTLRKVTAGEKINQSRKQTTRFIELPLNGNEAARRFSENLTMKYRHTSGGNYPDKEMQIPAMSRVHRPASNPMTGPPLMEPGTLLPGSNLSFTFSGLSPAIVGTSEGSFIQTPRLFFRKSAVPGSNAESSYEEVPANPRVEITQTPEHSDVLTVKTLNREIDSIADKVYRIIEKKISIEKDRRGLT